MDVLDRFDAKAVFNCCGAVVEKYPDLIRKLHDEGHEIAVHGYQHENLTQASGSELEQILKKAEGAVESVLGVRPIGERSPWLFYDHNLYQVLLQRGYRWVSNRSVPRIEIFETPIKTTENNRYWFDTHLWRLLRNSWRIRGYPDSPYWWGHHLLEIPLFSSMDGELLNLVSPHQESPSHIIEFTFQAWRRQYQRSGNYFNLNLHPWLIATKNRLPLLLRTLDFICRSGGQFILPRDLLTLHKGSA